MRGDTLFERDGDSVEYRAKKSPRQPALAWGRNQLIFYFTAPPNHLRLSLILVVWCLYSATAAATAPPISTTDHADTFDGSSAIYNSIGVVKQLLTIFCFRTRRDE